MALCRELAARSVASLDVRLLATIDAQPLAAIADGRLCRALYWPWPDSFCEYRPSASAAAMWWGSRPGGWRP